jgi:transposase-like protein
MQETELELFVNNLCADDYVKLSAIIDSKRSTILESKISNHQIIHRERTIDSSLKCPYCGSLKTVKNGHTKTGRQKYCCRKCNKSFSDTTNTIAFRSKKSYKQWNSFVSDTLELKSLRKSAAIIGISTTTAFSWRHKLLSTLSTFKKDFTGNLSSRIEADGMFFSINLKGTRPCNMPRASKKNGNGKSKRGISNHKVCVFKAVDDNDNSLVEIAGLGPESIEMLMPFKDRFEKNSLLITDSKAAFIEFAASRNMLLDQIPSGFHTSNNGNTISTINGYHAQIRQYLSPCKGVSTKHLQGYLDLFRFYKALKYTMDYKAINNKTYCYSISHNSKLSIHDIYKVKMPIDLNEAYGAFKKEVNRKAA